MFVLFQGTVIPANDCMDAGVRLKQYAKTEAGIQVLSFLYYVIPNT